MPGPNSPLLGELLRTSRVRAGLSQEALAEASGVSTRTISDLERGQRASAHLETIRLLATALDLADSERQQLLEVGRPDVPLATRNEPSPQANYGASRGAASIPTPATPLIGRSRELAELTARLDDAAGGIVTLTGPGGVGKTRLAIEAARLLAPTRADGACFVNLAMLTEAERVPDAIAHILGLSLQAESVGDQLKSFLANREALLMLDNFEHIIDAAPFVAALDAACAQLTILVTSRARLRLTVEHELALAPLPLADTTDPFDRLRINDANLLFEARAQRIDPDFALSDENAVVVTEICRQVDGLPLAIELAASRLRILPVPALLERLDRRLGLLTGGDRDRPQRQQSMRDTIAWSYDLLRPDEQRFFRWMAIFVGGLSLESAEALGQAIGLGPVESLEAVSSLIESGLAQRAPPSREHSRFHLFETIREFGLEQLAGTGELDAARRFHATYFLEFASRDAPHPGELTRDEWCSRVAVEHPNLISAFDALCAPESAGECLRFAAALGPYWDYRGPLSEAQPRMNRALAISSPAPTRLRLHVLFWTSLVLTISHGYEAALEVAGQCLELANQIGVPSDKAAALQAMAFVQEYHEHFDSARELLERAMELWESVGNTAMHANCLMLHAGLEYAHGELDRAKHEAAGAKTVFQDLGEIVWTAGATWYQGMFAIAGGELDLAAAHYEESLRNWLQSDSPALCFKPLVGLADTGAAAGCFVSASRLLGGADEMLAATGAELMPFDLPGYTRAETQCRDALGSAAFEALRLTGRRMSPDAWLADAGRIVECAQTQDETSPP